MRDGLAKKNATKKEDPPQTKMGFSSKKEREARGVGGKALASGGPTSYGKHILRAGSWAGDATRPTSSKNGNMQNARGGREGRQRRSAALKTKDPRRVQLLDAVAAV